MKTSLRRTEAPDVSASPDAEIGATEESNTATLSPLDVLTADEVAQLLRVDRKTVYGWIQRGELPGAHRLGRVVRIHRDTMLRWLAEGQDRVPRSRRNR